MQKYLEYLYILPVCIHKIRLSYNVKLIILQRGSQPFSIRVPPTHFEHFHEPPDPITLACQKMYIRYFR